MADAKIKNNLNKKSMYGLKLKELYAKKEALAKKQKELEIEVKNIFDAVDKTEKDGWENLDRNTININNSKRQIGWNKKLEINKIENEIIEVNSKIKSLKIQQKWEFVVSDSKMRGHIQMVVNSHRSRTQRHSHKSQKNRYHYSKIQIILRKRIYNLNSLFYLFKY